MDPILDQSQVDNLEQTQITPETAESETLAQESVETLPDSEPSVTMETEDAPPNSQTPEGKRHWYNARQAEKSFRNLVESKFGPGSFAELKKQATEFEGVYSMEDIVSIWDKQLAEQANSQAAQPVMQEPDFNDPSQAIPFLLQKINQLEQQSVVRDYTTEKSKAVTKFPNASKLRFDNVRADMVDFLVTQTGVHPEKAAEMVHGLVQKIETEAIQKFSQQRTTPPPAQEGAGGGNPIVPVDVEKMDKRSFKDHITEYAIELFKR